MEETEGDRWRQMEETEAELKNSSSNLWGNYLGQSNTYGFCMKPSNFIFTKWFVFEKNLPFMIAIRNFWHIWAFDSFLFSILCLI